MKDKKVSTFCYTNRFHLEYCKQKDLLNWDELQCLCKCLGYPHDTLLHLYNATNNFQEEGVLIKNMPEQLFKTKEFEDTFAFTFNHHSHEWNEDLIRTALHLITNKALSFDELSNIRSVFSAYESSDSKGLKLQQNTVLRCLKMCNRVVSSKKIMNRIKHMQEQFQEPGRIQLCEFLELVLWADLYEVWQKHVSDIEISKGKDEKLLWHLNNFHQVLKHRDTRLNELLNKLYIREEWTFLKERISSNDALQSPPINQQPRIQSMELATREYTLIKTSIQQSQFDILRASAGGYHLEARPQTAPMCLQQIKKQQEEAKRDAEQAAARARQVSHTGEITDENYVFNSSLVYKFKCQAAAAAAKVTNKTYVDATANADDKERKVSTLKTSEFDVIRKIRAQSAAGRLAVVTSEEHAETQEKLLAAAFDISTAAVRHRDYLREDLEYLRPGFWIRESQRTKPSPSPSPAAPVMKPKTRPSLAFLKRLSSARTREPLPSHRITCDAWQCKLFTKPQISRSKSAAVEKRESPQSSRRCKSASYVQQLTTVEERSEDVNEAWTKQLTQTRVWSRGFQPHTIDMSSRVEVSSLLNDKPPTRRELQLLTILDRGLNARTQTMTSFSNDSTMTK